ncbi:hypothetical protein GOP47_0014590 [Adiantum capillus-veneris]|uniref:RIIa domain-containing protein n=1 Tax=Adiantum capillus-veneris TaxID=13818 RepID=A0A9D4UM31_ADICA|nr:hypothetical protein GOP47_0014590 [Adiantum capillus-veneris]
MELDFEPIYCVEQIQVPLGLPDLLKKFTKEVLRRQPASLEEFAAQYFQQLLKKSKDNKNIQPPSVHQLQGVWIELKGKDSLKQAEIAEICSLNGIGLSIIDRVFQMGGFSGDMVDPKEVVILLITTSVKTFSAVLEAMFKVFGHNGGSTISVPLFFKLLFFIAKRDRDISPDTINALTKDLAERQEVTYNDIKSSPHLHKYFEKQ